MRRFATSFYSGALVSSFGLMLSAQAFSMKDHAMAKRKAREDERLGIVESDDDERAWLNEDEQRKIDDEEALRQKERADATALMLKEREAQDKLKKEKFKQWRVGQISKIKNRNEANTTNQKMKEHSREIEVEVPESLESAMNASGDFKTSENDAVITDITERRKEHRSMVSEIKRQERGEV
eukprot:GILI01045744.1.p1 GENE.GILI01045744.1~~GILI01045744.1.p1  ORF type:complete len:182 (-),score=34.21 GILI01045744.1:48-593(-)